MAQVGLMAAQAALSGVGSAISAIGNNRALVQQYKYAQQQQKLINKAAIQQLAETVGRNNYNEQLDAASSFDEAQDTILENQRRQAEAVASGSSNGITGSAIDLLSNSFQSAIGGVAAHLQKKYQQINAQTFFNNRDAQLQTQNTVNQAVPARPYTQNPLIAGLVGSLGGAANSFAQTGLNYGKTTKPKVEPIVGNPLPRISTELE